MPISWRMVSALRSMRADPDDLSAAGVDPGRGLVEIGGQGERDMGVHGSDQNRMTVFIDGTAPGNHKPDDDGHYRQCDRFLA